MKPILKITVILALFGLTSCFGGELTLCDCMEKGKTISEEDREECEQLTKKYDSEADVMKALEKCETKDD